MTKITLTCIAGGIRGNTITYHSAAKGDSERGREIYRLWPGDVHVTLCKEKGLIAVGADGCCPSLYTYTEEEV